MAKQVGYSEPDSS